MYSANTTNKTYQLLAQQSERLLNLGYGVIIDATFLKAAQRHIFITLCQQLSCPLTILNINCDTDSLKKRILSRQKSINNVSDADIKIMENQRITKEPLSKLELSKTIAINNSIGANINVS